MKAKINALLEGGTLPPPSSVHPSVFTSVSQRPDPISGRKVAVITSSLKKTSLREEKVPPLAPPPTGVQTQEGGRKKKSKGKGKKSGGQSPPPTGSQPTQKGKEGAKPFQPQKSQGPSFHQRPLERSKPLPPKGRATLPAKATKATPQPSRNEEKEVWLKVGRKTRNLVWEASGERAKSAGTKPKETGRRSAPSQPPSQAQLSQKGREQKEGKEGSPQRRGSNLPTQ